MATQPIPTGVPVAVPPSLEPLWRMTVEQYHAMIDAGILDADSRVELLEGVLAEKMSKNPGHEFTTYETREALGKLIPQGWYSDSQAPLTLADSEPEPDVMVVRGNRKDFLRRHPEASDVALVVEVAGSSIERDRNAKTRVYARAGIPVYWLIDLNTNTIEVRTEPMGDSYGTLAVYRRGDAVPVVIEGTRLGAIDVSQLLPE